MPTAVAVLEAGSCGSKADVAHRMLRAAFEDDRRKCVSTTTSDSSASGAAAAACKHDSSARGGQQWAVAIAIARVQASAVEVSSARAAMDGRSAVRRLAMGATNASF